MMIPYERYKALIEASYMRAPEVFGPVPVPKTKCENIGGRAAVARVTLGDAKIDNDHIEKIISRCAGE